MYEIYVCLRDEKGVKDATVAKETGIGKSTFSLPAVYTPEKSTFRGCFYVLVGN